MRDFNQTYPIKDLFEAIMKKKTSLTQSEIYKETSICENDKNIFTTVNCSIQNGLSTKFPLCALSCLGRLTVLVNTNFSFLLENILWKINTFSFLSNKREILLTLQLHKFNRLRSEKIQKVRKENLSQVILVSWALQTKDIQIWDNIS